MTIPMPVSRVKIVICWTNISGYMSACWRALAARPGVELSILAFESTSTGGWDAQFAADLVAGLDCDLLNHQQRNDADLIRDRVMSRKPDVVVLPGWAHPPYMALAHAPGLGSAKFIMGMDTSFSGNLRQRLARLKIGSYLDRMDAVIVAGERSFQLARLLKIPEAKILRGLYGFDDAPLANLLAQRTAVDGGWPKAFLYLGRYVPEKAIDVLLRGYAQYRAQVKEPWPLSCCGQGPLKAEIAAAAGVTDLGFVQPAELPRIFLGHGASILVSRFEPWGVALAEAMAAGLPTIASEACGAQVELVRHLYNGLIVPTDDAVALAGAMCWMHEHHADLAVMGAHAREFAAAHTAEEWAGRWHQRISVILDPQPTLP